jgi:hypothetical protein
MKNKTIIVLKYELENCSKCPLVCITRTKGAGYAEDYHCSALNKKIVGYVEWDSDLVPVPDWCPHRIEKIYGL